MVVIDLRMSAFHSISDWSYDRLKYLISNCVLMCIADKQLQMMTLNEKISTVKFIPCS